MLGLVFSDDNNNNNKNKMLSVAVLLCTLRIKSVMQKRPDTLMAPICEKEIWPCQREKET